MGDAGENKVVVVGGDEEKEAVADFGEKVAGDISGEKVSADIFANKVAAVRNLDDNILTNIAVRLPTMDAYRWIAVAPAWRFYTTEAVFLKQHLAPRRLKADDKPAALLVQPRNHERLGYVHALVLGLDAGYPTVLDFPLHGHFKHHAAAADAAPAPTSPEPDFVTFFKGTATSLDFSVIASHGRLLLARSPSHYFVVFPEADRSRFIRLPPPPVMPDANTAAAIHYDHVAGGIEFRVVLLVRVHTDLQQLSVHKYTSASGGWTSHDLGVHGASRCLGPSSTGISANNGCYYWLGGLYHRGDVFSYDEVSGTASVFLEPPTPNKDWRRHGRSLGSVGGNLRFSAFDALDPDQENMQPHEIQGLCRIWKLSDAGAWEMEDEVVCAEVSVHFFAFPYGIEVPYDFAGASSSSSFAVKNGVLLHRADPKGPSTRLCNLLVDVGGSIGELYQDCDLFPLFL